MSRECSVTKKGRQAGHKVSHANNKARKVWQVNLKWKRLFDSESKRWVRVKISTRTLRTISRKGLAAALRDVGMSVDDLAK
jgi:large subunit ribosomal protein L28